MKRTWAHTAGVLLGLIFITVGLGYLSEGPENSPWIQGGGALIAVAGVILFVKYFRRLRAWKRH